MINPLAKATFFRAFSILLLASMVVCPACGGGGAAAPVSRGLGDTPAPSTGSKTITADRTTIDFGNVTVGGSVTQAFNLQNTGTVDVTVSGITASGLGFNITPLSTPVVIKPGALRGVSVIFAPQAGLAMTGSVAVVSDATTNPTVNLSGTGIQ